MEPGGPAGSSSSTISSCTATSTAVAVSSLVTDASAKGQVASPARGLRGRLGSSSRRPRCVPGQAARPSRPSLNPRRSIELGDEVLVDPVARDAVGLEAHRRLVHDGRLVGRRAHRHREPGRARR